MTGLQRICRLYGSTQINGVIYLWDYVAEEAVQAKDMPLGSARRTASDKRRAEIVAEQMAISEPAP